MLRIKNRQSLTSVDLAFFYKIDEQLTSSKYLSENAFHSFRVVSFLYQCWKKTRSNCKDMKYLHCYCGNVAVLMWTSIMKISIVFMCLNNLSSISSIKILVLLNVPFVLEFGNLNDSRKSCRLWLYIKL